jgi:uncharacterized BrkB/YihY/UPF0761 family membrane protein
MSILLVLWPIGTLILFAVFCYVLGRNLDDKDRNDSAGLFFVAFMASLVWPLIIAFLIVFGPFYGLYQYGTHRRKTALEKKKMWDTLKK